MKATTLDKLKAAWQNERSAKQKRCKSAAGKHWDITCAAHNRKVLRKQYIVNRATRTAYKLSNAKALETMLRVNRLLAGLSPRVTAFGNSGTPKAVAQ